MDIDILARLVGELVMDRDEVELPGVGTFVAETVPAQFSDRGFTINPPYRKLSFRQRELGDMALLDSYAAACEGDASVARRELSDFLLELREVLKEKKTVVFPGLGRLRATRENHFFFVPDEQLDIYPEGFALESLSLKFHSAPDAGILDELVAAVTPVADKPAETPAESLTEPVQETAPETAAETPAEPVAVHSEREAAPRRRGAGARVFRAFAMAVAACALLLGFLALFGRVAPDAVDHLLYNKQELAIIHHS